MSSKSNLASKTFIHSWADIGLALNEPRRDLTAAAIFEKHLCASANLGRGSLRRSTWAPTTSMRSPNRCSAACISVSVEAWDVDPVSLRDDQPIESGEEPEV